QRQALISKGAAFAGAGTVGVTSLGLGCGDSVSPIGTRAIPAIASGYSSKVCTERIQFRAVCLLDRSTLFVLVLIFFLVFVLFLLLLIVALVIRLRRRCRHGLRLGLRGRLRRRSLHGRSRTRFWGLCLRRWPRLLLRN